MGSAISDGNEWKTRLHAPLGRNVPPRWAWEGATRVLGVYPGYVNKEVGDGAQVGGIRSF